MKLLLALHFTLLSVLYLDHPFLDRMGVITALVVIMIWYRENVNAIHICAIQLTIITLEYSVFHFNVFGLNADALHLWKNTRIYTIHLITDMVNFIVLAYRPVISRAVQRVRNKPCGKVHFTISDMSLMTVCLLFIVADLLAMFENFIRNLDYLGFDEEFAKQFWEWNWVFYNYPTIKSIIAGIELWAILSITTHAKKLKS
ncbi:hypothetical protein HUZ36_16680 [Pseudoalteromonas sp. McH1-7]|uniref:hypothetical protein n=1 Tax=unclassified Pseudoalteromonas TaxID=194690 RepID=UPI000FFF05AB|nr:MULTISPECIES: hypothetical protein [unclassified Pseudoalteromonas]NUZ12421.1 hypothetical protein [Pseudoalteromonas sp. McH1-7]RXF03171.1 hypothetical protein D9603_08850 [Pseudoalteromonas sp. PS5]